jgi:antitoxin YefM
VVDTTIDNTYVFAYDIYMINKVVTVSASDARADLYNLIKRASRGQESYEIVLRGSEPVIMMSKDEVERWIETLDVMSNPKLVADIRESIASDEEMSLDEVIEEMENGNYDRGKTAKSRNKTARKTPKK